MLDYKIIDLSIWMDDFTFPGNPVFQPKGPMNRVEGNNPEYVYDFELCSQSGTHIQGPHYFNEFGKKINQFPLECFQGKAYIMDVKKRGEDISIEDVKEELLNVDLNGRILIFRTGHMNEIMKDQYIDSQRRPGLSIEAARYLCEEKGIHMLAIDSIGLESRVSKNYEVNVYLGSKEILILECITNLHLIKGKEVFLQAFPLKIKGVEGTPCRAVAIVDK